MLFDTTDIYCGMLSHSKTVLALFHVIKVKVDREVQFQKHAFQLLGTLDTLLTVSMATHRQQAATVESLKLSATFEPLYSASETDHNIHVTA